MNLCSKQISLDKLQSLTLEFSSLAPPTFHLYGATFKALLSRIPNPLHTLHLKGAGPHLTLFGLPKVLSTLQSLSIHIDGLRGPLLPDDPFDHFCQLLAQGTTIQHLKIYRGSGYQLESYKFPTLLASLSHSPHLRTLEVPLQALGDSARELLARHTPNLRIFRCEIKDFRTFQWKWIVINLSGS
ncbi:hypothetical protein DL96DRAFT_1606715, partial [Flagelloscypha sp. PMI_526]